VLRLDTPCEVDPTALLRAVHGVRLLIVNP